MLVTLRQSRYSGTAKATLVIVAAAALSWSWRGTADAPADGPPGTSAAAAETTQLHSDRLLSRSVAQAVSDPLRVALEDMSEDEIKTFYTRCAGESTVRRMEGGEAMTCSIGYDVLLTRHFGGDIERLLTWSRAQRG